MFFAIVSPWNKKFEPILTENGCTLVKKKKDTVYFFYTETPNALIHYKRLLFSIFGINYIFSIYGFFHGMIDLFPYLPEEKKEVNPYYNQKIRDLPEIEMNHFLTTISS